MQHTLSFEVGDTKYVSRPFDFEAMCIINDAHIAEKKKGPFNMCRDAVDYMFEGTEADEEIINSLDAATRAELCLRLWRIYAEALTSKKE